jgi:hypothetical protein
MKVYEIISEGEGEYKLGAKILDWGLEKLGIKAEQMGFMRTISSQLADAKIAASKAGIDPATIGIKDLPSATRRLIQNSPYVAKDATLIPKAERLAQDVAEKEGSWLRKVTGTRPSDKAAKAGSGASAASGVAGATGRIIGGLAKLGVEAWWLKDATKPIQEYEENMSGADEWAAKDQIPDEYQKAFAGKTTKEWYDWYRARELSRMVGKLALVMGPSMAVRGGVGLIGSIFKILRLNKSAFLLSAAGSAGASVVAKILDDSETVNQIAALFTVQINDLFGLGIDIDMVNLIGAPLAATLDNTIGSLFGTAYERATGKKLDPDAAGVAGQKANAGADKDATSQKDTTDKPVSATDNTADKGEFPDGAPGTPGAPFTPVRDGVWRNTKTGRLVLY